MPSWLEPRGKIFKIVDNSGQLFLTLLSKYWQSLHSAKDNPWIQIKKWCINSWYCSNHNHNFFRRLLPCSKFGSEYNQKRSLFYMLLSGCYRTSTIPEKAKKLLLEMQEVMGELMPVFCQSFVSQTAKHHFTRWHNSHRIQSTWKDLCLLIQQNLQHLWS